jgi:hypothetical protein
MLPPDKRKDLETEYALAVADAKATTPKYLWWRKPHGVQVKNGEKLEWGDYVIREHAESVTHIKHGTLVTPLYQSKGFIQIPQHELLSYAQKRLAPLYREYDEVPPWEEAQEVRRGRSSQ